MTIEITEQAGHVHAMGHRVSLEAGGHAELRRRCLEQLSHLNEPPEEVRFAREAVPQQQAELPQEPGSARPALAPPAPDPPLESALESTLDAALDAAAAPPGVPPESPPPRAPMPTPAETPRSKRRLHR